MIRSDDSNQAEQWGRRLGEAARRSRRAGPTRQHVSPTAYAIAQVARLAGRASVSLWSARVS
jgi:hypothetical protein